MLSDARKAIEATRDKKISWEELKPIHAQLLRGEKSAGGINFGDICNREIVKDEIDYKESVATAVDVGIGIAAACAFIFSEIATADEATQSLAALLKNAELREDARMALERIEGEATLAALESALANAPDDFRPNLPQSLRNRGVNITGIPSGRLVPTKKTKVKLDRPA